jgi:lysophospholipase L1-like esterase
MRIAAHSKLLFIGDSITDAGRNKPAPAEGLGDPMGRGYVTLVDALLGSNYPERAIRVVNAGTSGHTVRDLASRWQSDVLDLKPDWLSVMIGINDVWRQFDSPQQAEIHVLPDEYRKTLDQLLSRTRPALKGLVLMTPYFIEPNKRDPMRARMDEYSAIIRKLAVKHGGVLADTQAAFDAVLKHQYPGKLAWDRVHPTQVGHMILAQAFLNAVGFEWKA